MATYEAPPDSELNSLLAKTFTNPTRSNYVDVEGTVLPQRFIKFQNDIRNFSIKDSDVWICGFPKTGTTWASEIAWLIVNDLDYENAKELDYYRTRQLDLIFLFNTEEGACWDNTTEAMTDSLNYCRKQSDPRTLKSHLPFGALPIELQNKSRNAKVIYTMRNPLDVCVSYYYQCVNYEYYSGTFDDFCKLFLFGKINYGPYYKHVASFWPKRDDPNFLMLTYEELKKDLKQSIIKIAKFLGKTLTEEQITRLQNYVTFENMKDNPAVNKQEANAQVTAAGLKIVAPFIRSGKIGGYKTVMSEEFVKEFKYWQNEWFKETGIYIFGDDFITK